MALDQHEQYLLELINRARLDPLAEVARYNAAVASGAHGGSSMNGLNQDLAPNTISATPKAPFAPNELLEAAAVSHSLHMLAVNQFEHDGIGDGTPGTRATAAGYNWTSIGENISWNGSTGAVNPLSSIDTHHFGLFRSAGHRTNLMSETFTEVGLGREFGQFTPSGTTFNASMLTEKFGRTGPQAFITGVAFNDADGDRFFDPGEGVGGLQITSAGGNTTTGTGGGYSLALAAGSHTLNFGGPLGPAAITVALGTQNIKVDMFDPQSFRSSVSATLGANAIALELIGIADIDATGNALDNVLFGNAGNNRFVGGAGNDTVDGGAGVDTYVAGAALASFTITRAGNTYTIVGGGFTDTVANVELFDFAGTVIDVRGDPDAITRAPPIDAGPGAETHDMAGANAFLSGTAANLFGDTVRNFGPDDTVRFTDVTSFAALSVSGNTVGAAGAAPGAPVLTFQGDFSGGRFMGVGTADGTALDFFFGRFLRSEDLVEEQAVAPANVNGDPHVAALTGNGAREFRVTLSDDALASFKNALGVYEVRADGSIVDTRLLFADVTADRTASTTVTGVEAGHRLGFFIAVGDADSAPGIGAADALSFVNAAGAQANVGDGSVRLAVNGTARSTTIFHSFSASLNGDGLEHARSGANAGGSGLLVAFEDLLGGGDRDFQDVVFQLDLIEGGVLII